MTLFVDQKSAARALKTLSDFFIYYKKKKKELTNPLLQVVIKLLPPRPSRWLARPRGARTTRCYRCRLFFNIILIEIEIHLRIDKKDV